MHGKKVVKKPIILYNEFPACKQCRFYKPDHHFREYGSIYGTCDKFGEKNIVTDKITYYYADHCRKDDFLCGKEGVEFKKEHFVFLKQGRHFLMSNKFNIFLVCLLGLYGAMIYVSIHTGLTNSL
jgi:Pyruvate/2-oxoacid:ferredoxin oxidoreductase delta subunit